MSVIITDTEGREYKITRIYSHFNIYFYETKKRNTIFILEFRNNTDAFHLSFECDRLTVRSVSNDFASRLPRPAFTTLSPSCCFPPRSSVIKCRSPVDSYRRLCTESI